jgi:Flp pilus assembly protein TadG
MEPKFMPTTCTSRIRTKSVAKVHRKESERGNALLELALGWTIMWLLFAGIYQFGYAMYSYNVLQTQVANAAELGAKLGYDSGSPATYTNAIKNMVLYGDETAGTKAVVPNLAASNVTVTLDSATFPTYLTVSITGYTIDAYFTTFSVSKPRATVSYSGQISCSTC